MKTTTPVRNCDGSGVRVSLTGAERRARVTHCPHCDREFTVRVANTADGPQATLPTHKPTIAQAWHA